MAQNFHNTLYLLTPGLSVHRDGLALRIEQDRQLKLSLPVHNLESVFVFGADIYLSPAVLRLCWENGASVCFFTDWGRLEARVEGVPRGSVLLRRASIAPPTPLPPPRLSPAPSSPASCTTPAGSSPAAAATPRSRRTPRSSARPRTISPISCANSKRRPTTPM
jgi:hypothetical protein